MIRFACPKCNASHSVSASLAGTAVRCQSCQESISVPSQAPPQPPRHPIATHPAKRRRLKNPHLLSRILLIDAGVGLALLLIVIGAAFLVRSHRPAITDNPDVDVASYI